MIPTRIRELQMYSFRLSFPVSKVMFATVMNTMSAMPITMVKPFMAFFKLKLFFKLSLFIYQRFYQPTKG